MIKRPEVVKIGPFLFTIYWDKDRMINAAWEFGSGPLSGHTDKQKLEIIINPEIDIQIQRETLWHEIKHGCYMWVASAIDNPSEEQIIALTTPIELSVLRENKDVLEFLTSA